MDGLIHRHRKMKTQSQNLDKGPWIKVLEKLTLGAGIIGPLMTIPQIFDIYYRHNAAGVSVLSWMAFGILDIPFLLYGFAHKDKPIIVTYILWFIANMTVAIGVLLYR